MRYFLVILALSVGAFASMSLDCAVFGGVWASVTRGGVSGAYECYAETDGMVGFSKKLDSVWVIGSRSYYECGFRVPVRDYLCRVDGRDTVSMDAGSILDTYFGVKKNLQY